MIPSQVRDTGGKPILVIGGGIAGVTTAVEAAEAGCEVILVETLPYLGGRVARAFRWRRRTSVSSRVSRICATVMSWRASDS